MARRGKVLVAGAGVFGLTIALALADAGLDVAVHDPAEPGDNASGVAAGMLAPVMEAVLDPVARPHLDLLLAARDLWPALAARAGVDLDRAGALVVGESAWLAVLSERLTTLGADLAPVAGADLATLAPGLAEPLRQGISVPGDWRLDARLAMAALRRAGEAAGVTYHRTAVDRVGGGELVIVATGASRSLAGAVPELAALSPIKGHILRVPRVLGRVLRAPGVYAVPTEGGLLIGATMEAGLDDRHVDPAQVQRLRAAAESLFPALADAPATAMAAVRAATADGLPLAGPARARNVLIAAGARRNGWLLAPLVAQVVTAYATGREPGPMAARLAPARFNRPG